MGEPFKLKNGSILVSTEAPGGLYNAAQLKKIAALCESDAAVAKATEDQRLALFIKPDKATNVVKELRAVGLGVRHYQDGVHQPVSCIGQLCSEYKQDALASAMELSENLRGVVTKSSLKIGINGCAKCCVPTHTLDVSAIGDESGYRISIGGKTSQIPELASFLAEAVPATELSTRVTQLAKAFADQGEPGESLQEMIERGGASQFVQIFAPYSQDAAGGGDDFNIDGTSDDSTSSSASEMPSDDIGAPMAETVSEDELNLSTDDELAMGSSDEPAVEMSDIDPSTHSDAAMDDINLDISPGQDTAAADLELNDEIALSSDSIESAELSPESEADLSLDGLEEDAIPDLEVDEAVNLNAVSDDATAELGSDLAVEAATEADLSLDIDSTDSLEMNVEDDVATANVEAAQSEPQDLKLDLDDAATDFAEDSSLTAVADITATDDINLEAVEPELVDAVANASEDDDLDLTLDDEVAASPESHESEEQDAETRLEESIAVEATIDEAAEADENADERAEALRLVSEQESEAPAAAKTAINPNLIPEDDLDLEVDETPDFGEIAADLDSTSSASVASPRSNTPSALPARAKASPGTGFNGVNVDPRGVVVLSFGSGMTIELNATEIATGSQDYQLGGQAVRIEKSEESVSVSVNGIRLNLPSRKAA